MKKNIRKKIMSIILTLAMVLSLLPAMTLTANAIGTAYTFDNLATTDGDGDGYVTVGDYFKVEKEKYTQDIGSETGTYTGIYPSDTNAMNSAYSSPYAISIKAEGGTSCKTFTFDDIGFSAYYTCTNPVFTSFDITFYDSSGDVIGSTVNLGASSTQVSTSSVTKLTSIYPSHSTWNVNGVAEVKIEYVLSTNGGTGASNLLIENMTISNISNVLNTAPTLVTNAGITVAEGSSNTTISSSKLATTDSEQSASALTYTVTTLPAKGSLKKNGVTLTTNGTFTQDDINNNKITYTHDGSETTSDSFKFTVSDGNGGSIGETTFAITVTTVNDAPTVPTNGTLSINEDSTAATISSANLTSTDAEGSTVTYTLTVVPTKGTMYKSGVELNTTTNSTFDQADIDANRITYAPTANINGTDSFVFAVSDGTANLTGQTFNISITSVNDAPTLATNAGITVAEGSAGNQVLQSKLEITDTDQAASAITYTLTAVPSNGTLYNNGVILNTTTNKTLTQADINNNKITYTHNGSENSSDSFLFTASDGDGGNISENTFAITITVANDAPSISDIANQSTDEDIATGAIAFAIGDEETAPADLTVLVTSSDQTLVPDGNIALGGTGVNRTITLTPVANQNGSSLITVKVKDPSNVETIKSFPLTVNSINDLPTVSNFDKLANEDEEMEFTLTDFTNNYADPVEHSTLIQIKVTGIPANGVLKIGTSSVGLNDVIPSTSLGTLKFVPASNWSGTTSFTWQGYDGSSYSDNATINITIAVVNDSPTVATNNALAINEDASATVIGNAKLNATDEEGGTVTYTLTIAPLNGILYKNGTALVVSGNFTQTDIDGSMITYTPSANANGTDSFGFSVSDGTSGLTGQAFNILIDSVNDLPSIATNAGMTVAEGSVGTVISKAKLEIEDADQAAASITYTLTAIPSNGTLYNNGATLNTTTAKTFTQADINNGKITYTHNGSETISDTFKFTALDGDGGSIGETTFAITVTAANDAPSVSDNNLLTLIEDATSATISNTLLYFIDSESDAVTYLLVTAPAKGTLYKDNVALNTTTNRSFTQTDIDGNKITYIPSSNANGTDSFGFAVSDGISSANGQTFNLFITAVNDAPIITSATTVNFTEAGTGTAYTAAGADSEGTAIIWSISGSDAAQFTISSVGAIAFKNSPSFTIPTDSDSNNAYLITLTASDGSLTTSSALTINVVKKSSSGQNTESSSTNINPSTTVVVNGESRAAGTAETKTENGKIVTTTTIDDTKLDAILKSEGDKATVTIPSTAGSDITVGVLNGQTVKNMEEKEAVLEIQTGSVTYTLPASEINIDAVSQLIGEAVNLKDIKISVSIAEPSAGTVKIVEDTANKNNYQLVVEPVEFEITCTSGDKTIEVSKFNGYVERTVAIPDGIDPSRITTGIVLNTDGTFSHVPTSIIVINGKYYAKINSLTNSTYSVIYNPIELADVASHWAKDSINNMGSRLIVTGDSAGNYNPNKEITRAEFATIIVRALGLKEGIGDNTFADVKDTAWYCGYTETAVSYGIISGYNASTFGPNDKITREQAMAMIARAMKLTGLETSLTDSEVSSLLAKYTDAASTSGYAKVSIADCLNASVFSGRSDGTIAPKNYITRAEVAVIVERLLKNSKLI